MTTASALLVAGLLLAGPPAGQAPAPAGGTTALRTFEGTVTAVGEAAGEGKLPLVSLEVQTAEGGIRVLVAPAPVLSDLGFTVKVGDRIRARVFYDAASRTAFAQKVLNQSQELLVRLRTLRHEPLWDAAGTWQGGETDPPQQRPTARTRRRTTRQQPSATPPERPRPPLRPPG